MNKSWQNLLRSVNLKNSFTKLGLENVYEFLRIHIIMNNMTFMVLCAFLFLMIFAGFQFDSTFLKVISLILLIFFVFFKFTIIF